MWLTTIEKLMCVLALLLPLDVFCVFDFPRACLRPLLLADVMGVSTPKLSL